jgi:hypothetical protein
MRRPAVTLFFLLILGPLARADWPVARGPAREPAPYIYDPAIWKKVPSRFLDDAPACILYAATSYLVEKDGTVEKIEHEIVRLNSRKAVEKLGESQQVIWTPAHEQVTLNVARIHKANGQVVPVEARHVRVRDASSDSHNHDADRQLIISYAGLEVGDVVELKWTARGRHPEHGQHFFRRYVFGHTTYPLVRDELRVELPLDRPLKWDCIGGKLTPVITPKNDRRLYVWSASNLEPLPRDEDRPSAEELRLRVAVSTFRNWDEVGNWRRQLRAGRWECTPEIRKIVADTTRGLKTPIEKARALTQWVRRNIRYISGGERHDYTPRKPADVVADRRGDCKDGAQLLAVMLREVGIPAALASLGVRDDGQILESVPSGWSTHALVLARIAGKEHWIDTTATLQAWDFLPRNCRDRLCYVVEDRSVRLVRTPGLTPSDNQFEQTTEITIAVDGSSRARRTSVYRGLAASAFRDRYLEVPTGEQRRLAAARLQDEESRAQLVQLWLGDDLKNLDSAGVERTEWVVPGHFAGQAREAGFSDPKVWPALLDYKIDAERKVPLVLWAPLESRHRYVVYAPQG